MARVLLITADTAHAAYANTKAALEAGGHTVTGALDSANLASLGSFDIVASVRATAVSSGALPAWATYMYNQWVAGVPLLIGGTEAGSTAPWGYHVAKDLGIMNSVTLVDSSSVPSPAMTNIAAHPITVDHTPGTSATVLQGQNFAVYDGFGSALGMYNIDSPYMRAVAATDSLIAGGRLAPAGNVAPARAVWCGWLYAGQADYTPAGRALIKRTTDWLLETPPGAKALSGTAAGKAVVSGRFRLGEQMAVQNAQGWIADSFEHVVDPVGSFGDTFIGVYYGPW